MATKTKVNDMSEEEEKNVTQWFLEARSDRSLSKRSMEERYPLVYAMTDGNQQEPQQEEQPKEDETIASTDSSAATPPSEATEPTSMEATQQDHQTPVHRVSSKQRRLSFEEYRSVYLPVPKIENRMPVFISASLRDELDKIARRLGGKRMSASGIVENMVKQHLIIYGDELKEWYKL